MGLNTQYEPNKLKHWILATLITYVVGCIAHFFAPGLEVIYGVAAGIIAATGKELGYDYILKKGNPTWADFFMSIVGVVTGLIGLLITFGHNQSVTNGILDK